MIKSKNILFLLLILLTSSCKEKLNNKNSLLGLWEVTKVTVGTMEMTPAKRWMRFQADSTQTSGNGWLQHSIGTWNYNTNTKKLKVNNENGILDEFEDFIVSFEGKKMQWNRNEDGEKVKVTLKRIDKIPTSEANKLYGLWKFESIVEDKEDITKNLNPQNKAMLFLRWDNTYVLHNYPEGELYGMFKTHAHRKQIDMVSYSKIPKFQFYEFHLTKDTLYFRSTNSEKKIKLTRINKFLN